MIFGGVEMGVIVFFLGILVPTSGSRSQVISLAWRHTHATKLEYHVHWHKVGVCICTVKFSEITMTFETLRYGGHTLLHTTLYIYTCTADMHYYYNDF